MDYKVGQVFRPGSGQSFNKLEITDVGDYGIDYYFIEEDAHSYSVSKDSFNTWVEKGIIIRDKSQLVKDILDAI